MPKSWKKEKQVRNLMQNLAKNQLFFSFFNIKTPFHHKTDENIFFSGNKTFYMRFGANLKNIFFAKY